MTPESARAEYRRMLDRIGEDVFIRRYMRTGTNRPYFEAKARARISYEIKDPAWPTARAVILAQDLEERQFPEPINPGDKIIVGTAEYGILDSELIRRTIAGVVVAYECVARGLGLLDREIIIYTVSEAQDASGDAVPSLVELATVPAQVMSPKGTETPIGATEQARSEKTFRIAWRPDVTNKHVISYTPHNTAAAELYDIVAIAEVGRQDGLDISATAKVN